MIFKTARVGGAVKTSGSRLLGPVLTVLVLAVGVTATMLVVGVLRADDRRSADRVMDQRTSVARAAVSAETGRYLDLLRTVAAGVGANDRLTAAGFQAASAPLADARLLGATSVSYAVAVPHRDVERAQRFWRDRGATGLLFQPRGEPEEHLFSVFSRPLPEPALLGIDITASAEAAGVLNEARRTRAPAVSDTYVLLRDRGLPPSQQHLSFAFAAPVYGPPAGGEPVFRGWIVMGLRGQQFLGGVLRESGHGLLDAELRATNGDGRQLRVASYATRGNLELRRQVVFWVANRQWRLHTGADPDSLPGAHSSLPDTVLLGGMLLTVLLAWLVRLLATGRYRARAQVLVATAELRSAEAEARRQAGLLGAVMASHGDGVWVVDSSGASLLHNPAAEHLLGASDDTVGPDGWQQHYGLYRPDGRTPFPTEEMPLVRALHGDPSDGVELIVRNRARGEDVLVSVDGRPLDPGTGQRGAVGVFRDITELRRYEADLSAFAGVVAHDLKSPLTVIRGHCETAADVLGDEPDTVGTVQARSALHRIAAAVDRMAALIDTLLAYTTSRDAPVRLQTVPLGPLVDEVVAGRTGHHRPNDGPAPDIFVGPLPEVTADPAMLHHVVDNLIGNALKYVAPGRVPRIDITAGPATPGWTRVEIADRGIGIPDDDKPDVFESFHRARSAAGYAGTGLGLAICRRIVERHGGTIGVTDNPGGGTRFHFTLPAAVPAPVEPAAPAPVEPAAPVQEEAGNGQGQRPADRAAVDRAAVDRAAVDRALAERAAVAGAVLPDGAGPRVHAEPGPSEHNGTSHRHDAVIAGETRLRPAAPPPDRR